MIASLRHIKYMYTGVGFVIVDVAHEEVVFVRQGFVKRWALTKHTGAGRGLSGAAGVHTLKMARGLL